MLNSVMEVRAFHLIWPLVSKPWKEVASGPMSLQGILLFSVMGLQTHFQNKTKTLARQYVLSCINSTMRTLNN